MATRIPIPNTNHFLYLGGMDAATDTTWLNQHNVKYILDIGADYTYNSNESKDIIYIRHNIPDKIDADITSIFDECHDFIDNAFSTNSVILVHCGMGWSRSPTIIISYIMKKHKLRFSEVFNYVKNLRGDVDPNSGFKLQLEKYDKILFG